jgi:DNA invertase Pin-like site-specific DNA recombinase
VFSLTHRGHQLYGTEPKLALQMFAAFAEFERGLIIESTRA